MQYVQPGQSSHHQLAQWLPQFSGSLPCQPAGVVRGWTPQGVARPATELLELGGYLQHGLVRQHRYLHRADSGFGLSQWEIALLCNDVSHCLGTNLESDLLHLFIYNMVWLNTCSLTKAYNVVDKADEKNEEVRNDLVMKERTYYSDVTWTNDLLSVDFNQDEITRK